MYVGSVLVVRPESAILHYTIALRADSQEEAWSTAVEEATERWTSVSGRVFVEVILDSLEEVLDEPGGTGDQVGRDTGAPEGWD